uniref:Uncharacterized protein n=1 Tax=Arundo donax TaxID=35708 RepID=A0A0A8YQE3_ARUDO
MHNRCRSCMYRRLCVGPTVQMLCTDQVIYVELVCFSRTYFL